MILRFSAISDKFRNPERLTASENMKPFISSYTIQSHIFLINIKLSNMSKSSIKSRDDKLRSKKRSNQLWTQSLTRSRIASLCQICQSWLRCSIRSYCLVLDFYYFHQIFALYQMISFGKYQMFRLYMLHREWSASMVTFINIWRVWKISKKDSLVSWLHLSYFEAWSNVKLYNNSVKE